MSYYIREMLNKIRNYNQTLNEYSSHSFENEDYIKDILKKLGIYEYKILGIGQHGVAILTNDKVYKFTISNHEINIAKFLLNSNFKTLPKIYELDSIDGINYYVRDYFYEISDDFAEDIGENIEEIEDYFQEKNMDIRKSNTNLDYEFNDKFLDFLENLKKDMYKLGIKNNFDLDALSINLGYDENGNFVLFDF